ncbi:MAG: tryptophan-rich sensory protein [Synergistaceae bacterium]|nr:tryptophan-rich sensory protein [Synergistaceae bacterium]
MKNLKIFAFWIFLSEAVGITAGILTRSGVRLYSAETVKPLLSPPPVIFPVVWTILYALMGYGAAKIFITPSSKERTRALGLFLIQLFFNFGWCFLFFSFKLFGAAFLWIIVLVMCVTMMFFAFLKVDKLAAYLQIPYWLWLLFASYLNFSVWILN